MKCALAAMALLAAPVPLATASSPGQLEFVLFRNGHPDGSHSVNVMETPGGLEVRSQIRIRVALGPMTLYHYEQRCRETWAGGALASLNCDTQKNGRRTLVSARKGGAAIEVRGARAETFPLTSLPTSWWVRPPSSTSAMINTETGAPLQVRVERVGRETRDVGGRPVVADHIRVVGTMVVDLWYDQAGHWIGCAFTVSGQHFEYRLTSPLDGAPTHS